LAPLDEPIELLPELLPDLLIPDDPEELGVWMLEPELPDDAPEEPDDPDDPDDPDEPAV